MLTECVEACPSGDSADGPSVPPGFSSFLTFTLKKSQDMEAMPSIGFSPPAVLQVGRSNDVFFKDSEDKLRKSLRQKPSINYNEVDNSSEEEPDAEFMDHVSSINTLKKGVIRGCSNCVNCQKVLARWKPADSRRPVLEEAPVFHPSEEEFKDTLKYIESIREKAEHYGICRIVPPPSWQPPCPLKEKNVWESSKFATRVQRLDRLQKRPTVKQLSRYQSMGRRKRRRLLKQSIENRNIDEYSAETSYSTYYPDNFGFEPGPFFSLESFSKYADDFKVQYFMSDEGSQGEKQKYFEPSVEDVEGEYWRIVEKPTEEIEVLYGADVETANFCSGFPRESDNRDAEEYVKSGWNLNNFPRLPGSVLAFESAEISGVLVPWLYVGMCFSSFCWHVEDHHLYSLNYMHWGAPKMWYGVPGGHASKLEDVMKKHLPELFEEQPDLLHKLVTQFSPSILSSEGVPVYRCVQHAGEFVLTFPRGYHSGFNCGFNCAEAVNVAPFDWLPHGQNAVELYRDQCRKITISHDKLLLGAARQAVRAQWESIFLKKDTSDILLWKNVCGSDKVLAKALKARLEIECSRRKQFCSASQCRKMDANFDGSGDKECFICHYDLYLSATGCLCSPNKYACLSHAEQLCSCDRSMRTFLFRYEISEMTILVDALGGKLSAIHKWGFSDLGLSLSSFVAKRKDREQSVSNLSSIKENQLVKPDTDASCGASLHSQEFCAHIEKGHGDHVLDVKVDLPSCKPRLSLNEKRQTEPLLDDKVPEALFPIGQKFNQENGLGNAKNNYTCKFDVEEKDAFKASLEVPTDANLLRLETSFRACDDNEKSDAHGNLVPAISNSKGDAVKFLEDFARTRPNNVHACDLQEKVLHTPETSVSMTEGETCLLQNADESGLQNSCSNIHEKGKGEMLAENILSALDRKITLELVKKTMQSTGTVSASIGAVAKDPVILNQVDVSSSLPKVSVADGKVSSNSIIKITDVTEASSCPSNSVEGFNLQRGPRMAKVVRRFNCSVEPLQLGVVLPGKLWSTNQAIYPKGYRSRVRYFSIRDPTQLCYYASEILDGGLYGPLFMVQVENCPGEVFIHLSPSRCWDMVRERINHEIRRQHGLGKSNVLALQPPGSVDGLEMFGLSSPPVIQAIEALDQYHLCSEYWKSRNLDGNMEASGINPYLNLGSRVSMLGNLFKKADFEELNLLHLLLGDAKMSFRQEISDLLYEHIQRFSNSTNCT